MYHDISFHDFAGPLAPYTSAAPKSASETAATDGCDKPDRLQQLPHSTSADSAAAICKVRCEDWLMKPELPATIYENTALLPQGDTSRRGAANALPGVPFDAITANITKRLADDFIDRIAADLNPGYAQMPKGDDVYSLAQRIQGEKIAGILANLKCQSQAVRDYVLTRVAHDLSTVRNPLRADLASYLAEMAKHSSGTAQGAIGESLAHNVLFLPSKAKAVLFNDLLGLAKETPLETDAQHIAKFPRERIIRTLGAFLPEVHQSDRAAALTALTSAVAELPTERAAEYLRACVRHVSSLRSPEDRIAVLEKLDKCVKIHGASAAPAQAITDLSGSIAHAVQQNKLLAAQAKHKTFLRSIADYQMYQRNSFAYSNGML